MGPQTPGWATQENGKETRLWPIEWGSICCSSVQSPTPSHAQPFQIKWEVYFSKRLCRSSLLCRCYDSACICVCIVVHGYATNGWQIMMKFFTVAMETWNLKEAIFFSRSWLKWHVLWRLSICEGWWPLSQDEWMLIHWELCKWHTHTHTHTHTHIYIYIIKLRVQQNLYIIINKDTISNYSWGTK